MNLPYDSIWLYVFSESSASGGVVNIMIYKSLGPGSNSTLGNQHFAHLALPPHFAHLPLPPPLLVLVKNGYL